MLRAAPIYRAAAQAVIGGDISAAAACHKLMPWVVTVMTGTDGSSTPCLVDDYFDDACLGREQQFRN